MAISGHIMAHMAQPVHLSGCVKQAGKKPAPLNRVSTIMEPFGHASMQYSHPLQRSVSITIFPFGVMLMFISSF